MTSTFYYNDGTTSTSTDIILTKSSYDTTKTLINVDISNEVIELGTECFKDCMGLTSVIVPDNVTLINDYCFQDCRNLTSITLSQNLIRIGDFCFRYCGALTSAIVPSTIEDLGTASFANCSNMSSITIETNKIKILKGFTFVYCSSITSIKLPNMLETIGENCFNYCINLESITFPSTLKKLDLQAFVNCKKITSIILPQNLEYIGYNCFGGCQLLGNVTFMNPHKITVFNPYRLDGTLIFPHPLAFQQTKDGIIVNYYNTKNNDDLPLIVRVNQVAFTNPVYNYFNGILISGSTEYLNQPIAIKSTTENPSVKFFDINIQNNIYDENNTDETGNLLAVIGNFSTAITKFTIKGFDENNNKITNFVENPVNIEIDLPFVDTNTTLYIYKLEPGTTNLIIPQPANFPVSLTYDSEKLKWTSQLTSLSEFVVLAGDNIDLQEGIPNNEVTTFYYDDGTISTTIDTIITTNSYTTLLKESITSITFSSNVVELADDCFMGCSSLKILNIPNNINLIGQNCFKDCVSLESVVLSNNIINLSNNCFQNCSSLSSVILPSNIEIIGDYCFQNCSSLTIITFPLNLTSLGNYTFQNCSNLEMINYTNPKNMLSIGTSCFSSTKANIKINYNNVVEEVELPTVLINSHSQFTTPIIDYIDGLLTYGPIQYLNPPINIKITTTDANVEYFENTIGNLRYLHKSGVQYGLISNYTTALAQFSLKAYDDLNNLLSDFTTEPINIEITLPNADTASYLNIYKLEPGTLNIMTQQPENFPTPLVYNHLTSKWIGNLSSLSDFIILSDDSMGPTGPTGEMGMIGEARENGFIGSTGSTGESGVTGDNSTEIGSIGSTGSTGATGIQGENNTTIGPTGSEGLISFEELATKWYRSGITSVNGNTDGYQVIYGNNMYVAIRRVSNKSIISTSTDALVWTDTVLSLDIQNINWTNLAWGNDIFVGTSASSNKVITSTDGINWNINDTTHTPSNPTNNPTVLTFGNGLFVAAGRLHVKTSTNGVNWSVVTLSSITSNPKVLKYLNGMFFISNFGSNSYYYSNNGTTWSIIDSGSHVITDFAYDGKKFLASNSNVNSNIGTSTNGINWSWFRIGTPITSQYKGIKQLVYGGGKYYATFDLHKYDNLLNLWTDNYVSENGVDWTAGSSFDANTPFSKVFYSDRFVQYSSVIYVSHGILYGERGSTGERGLTGEEGPMGYVGYGHTGSTGDISLKSGDTGIMGSSGYMGSTGSTGPMNDVIGSEGFTGPAGPTVKGSTGSIGIVGETGYTGSKGQIGSTGIIGANGATNLYGYEGAIGKTGSLGFIGSKGENVIGPFGPRGLNGVDGETGYDGDANTEGYEGQIGLKGETGFEGPKGLFGDSKILLGEFKGRYNSFVEYSMGDIVLNGKFTFISNNPTKSRLPIPKSVKDWTKVPSNSEWAPIDLSTGPQGIMGPIGDVLDGPTGKVGKVGKRGPRGVLGNRGYPGIDGPDGLTGGTLLTFKGSWNSSISYKKKECIKYENKIYTPLLNSKNLFPNENPNHWLELPPVGTTGPTGETGPKANDGPIGATGEDGEPYYFKGFWSSIINYNTNDIVIVGNNYYISLKNNNINNNVSDNLSWSVYLANGFEGPAGPTGLIGDTGVQGLMGPTGITGLDGPKGRPGPKGIRGPTGYYFSNKPEEWKDNVKYIIGSNVIYSNNYYISTNKSNLNIQPDTDNISWLKDNKTTFFNELETFNINTSEQIQGAIYFDNIVGAVVLWTGIEWKYFNFV